MKRYFGLFFILMGVLACGTGINPDFEDIPYANQSDAQKLDIYLPDSARSPFPVIVAIHGGGFMFGDKTGSLEPMLEGLNRGYAVVSINYRLSGEAKFPAAIYDIKAAIRWIKVHASDYNLNAEKVAVWGGSAGGNLAALVGTSGGVAELEDRSLGNATGSSTVQAVINWFGPIYFSKMDEQFKALGLKPALGATNSKNSPESRYIGYTVGTQEAESLVIQASPQTYISPDDPPFYIQHGTADRNIPITQSVEFAQHLAEVLGSKQVIFDQLEGAGHGGAEFETLENLNRIYTFLDQVLREDY